VWARFATSSNGRGPHSGTQRQRPRFSLHSQKDLLRLVWNKRMSTTELHGDMGRTEHAPIWAVALAGTLLAASFGRRRAEKEAAARDEVRASGSGIPSHDDRTPADEGRGRAADTPWEIPAKGWKDILLRVYRGISEDRIFLIAAGVTFYILLAIFPGVAALISIYGLIADPANIASHLDTIANVAPGGAIEVLRDQMTRLGSQGGTTLGFGFIIGLVISLWTASSGIKGLFDALNIVYGEDEKRSFLTYYLTALALTLAAIAFVLVAIAIVVLLPVVLNFIPLPGGTDLLVKIARWPILFVLAALALSVLYRYGPSRSQARWRWITWGSALATVMWIAASVLFSWYVANFGSYNKTYGSLGAIVGFMTWIWISIIIVLLGAKLDAEMEHQTARETTSVSPNRSECAAHGWPTRSARHRDHFRSQSPEAKIVSLLT
jgi:membrane protein